MLIILHDSTLVSNDTWMRLLNFLVVDESACTLDRMRNMFDQLLPLIPLRHLRHLCLLVRIRACEAGVA